VIRTSTAGAPACAVLAIVIGGAVADCARAAEARPTAATPGQVALDYGFRFASAIHNDPKDRQKAQQAVVMEYARIGLTEEALQLARKIDGWRKGVALADLAARLAREGREDLARTALREAEEVRAATKGWEGPRVAAHVAQAHATLGEMSASESIAADLAANDPQQYTGRSAATVATAHAARGDFDGAMQELARYEGSTDREVAWWRTAGYLGLAREERLEAAQRRKALDAARASADGLVAWKRSEALQEIAQEYRAQGAMAQARDALAAASRDIEALPDTDAFKSVLLASIGGVFAEFGETERVPGLLGQAEAAVPEVLNLDRPAAYANIASSWHAAGNGAEAWRLYDLALDAAEELQNPRPRALGLVAVCRSLGRSGIDLTPEARQRLDQLLGGLQGP
jgi:hypothetical protein